MTAAEQDFPRLMENYGFLVLLKANCYFQTNYFEISFLRMKNRPLNDGSKFIESKVKNRPLYDFTGLSWGLTKGNGLFSEIFCFFFSCGLANPRFGACHPGTT